MVIQTILRKLKLMSRYNKDLTNNLLLKWDLSQKERERHLANQIFEL